MNTVLYIMSDTRSGSTLLENLLSKSRDMVSVGEIYHLNSFLHFGKWGSRVNWECTCGNRFADCQYWNRVLEAARSHGVTDFRETQIEGMRNRSGMEYIRSGWPKNEINIQVLQTLKGVFDAVFEVTGAKVIIDSSKNPIQGLALYQALGIPVKVIYLKRDIRAVAFSKKKWMSKLWNKEVNPYKLVMISKLYDMRCKSALKKIAPEDKIELKYEDLARYPQQEIQSIIEKFDLPSFPVPDHMYIDEDHTVGGTPNLRMGKRKIAYDDSWHAKVEKRPVFNVLGLLMDKV